MAADAVAEDVGSKLLSLPPRHPDHIVERPRTGKKGRPVAAKKDDGHASDDEGDVGGASGEEDGPGSEVGASAPRPSSSVASSLDAWEAGRESPGMEEVVGRKRKKRRGPRKRRRTRRGGGGASSSGGMGGASSSTETSGAAGSGRTSVSSRPRGGGVGKRVETGAFASGAVPAVAAHRSGEAFRLARLLESRPSAERLRSTGILPDAEFRAERWKASAQLDRFLAGRPMAASLVERSVLRAGPKVEASLHAVQSRIARKLFEDALARRLRNRARPEELMARNILKEPGKGTGSGLSTAGELESNLRRRPAAAALRREAVLRDAAVWWRLALNGKAAARNCHTATRVGGRVVIVGGYHPEFHVWARVEARAAEIAQTPSGFAPPARAVAQATTELRVPHFSPADFPSAAQPDILDVRRSEWVRLRPQGDGWAEACAPGSRYAHSAVAVDDRSLLVFGGYGPHGWMADLWSLETATDVWKPVPSRGAALPPPRAAHVAGMLGRDMVVFGGNDGTTVFGDTWSFHVDSCLWTLLPTTVSPPPRTGHAAVAVDEDHLVLFGGSQGFGTAALNDLWVLSRPTNPEDPWLWTAPATSGPLPRPRAGHCATLTGSDIVVFGGEDSGRAFNDTVALDLHSLLHDNVAKWRPLPDAACGVPVPRAGHSATPIGSCILVFGGAVPDGSLCTDCNVLDTHFQPQLPASDSPIPSMPIVLEDASSVESSASSIPKKTSPKKSSSSSTTKLIGPAVRGGDEPVSLASAALLVDVLDHIGVPESPKPAREAAKRPEFPVGLPWPDILPPAPVHTAPADIASTSDATYQLQALIEWVKLQNDGSPPPHLLDLLQQAKEEVDKL